MNYSPLIVIGIFFSLVNIASASEFNANTVDPEKETKQEPRKFTAERIFDLEYADAPQLSPDGRTVVYLRRSMDRYTDRVVGNLWKIDVRSKQHRPLIVDQGSVSAVRWSPSGDRFVYLTTIEGKPSLRVYYMDSGKHFPLAQLEKRPSEPVWSPDGSQIAFSMQIPGKKPSFATAPTAPKNAEWASPVNVIDDLVFRFDGAGYLEKATSHIFTIDAEGGTPRQITNGEYGYRTPSWLGNDALVVVGNAVEHAELDPIESELYKISLDDLSLNTLTARDGPDHSAQGSPDGKMIAYLGYDDELKAYQQTDLYVMPAEGITEGKPVKNLTANFDRSVGNFQWSSNGSIVASVNVDGQVHLIEFDLSGNRETLIKDLGGTSLGRPYAAGSFSVAKNTIAYTQTSAERPADIAVSRGGKSQTLTDLNSDFLRLVDVAPIEEISVKSTHDGRDIEAWVALPQNFTADGTFPMILEIHGGPFAMYGPFFAAEIQRFAAEGYVTVYVNPRGSTGYGEEFAQLIDKAYPGNDHDDLMSVVDELVERQYVSSDRLFITGGSGGGVLTAWAVGKTDRFAAAATIKPVINWATMAMAADIAAFVGRHWMGMHPWEDPEFYWKQSPISLVGNVKTPTLVMVGEQDWRTPAWEAEQYYTALKLQKIETALIRIPGASHSIAARPSQMIAKIDNIVGWFKKYDAPQSGQDVTDR